MRKPFPWDQVAIAGVFNTPQAVRLPAEFEIIRQVEAFGFCERGEGGAFVQAGNLDPGGRFPVNTDGGMLAYSNIGSMGQMLQKVIRGVQQPRGGCGTGQVNGAGRADSTRNTFAP